MDRRVRYRFRLGALAAILLLAGCSAEKRTVDLPPPTRELSPALSVAVSGNRLVDATGQPLRLLGVNRSGTEYACSEGWGIFDGPSDSASVAAMAAWNINAVRVPLNEACWLGHRALDPAYSGESYRRTIGDYVDALHRADLIVVLDLHWSAPGDAIPNRSPRMPNADHSPEFWRSVATHFKDDHAVAFELFNEPREVDWRCWRDGCETDQGWTAAGMQSLLDAVRSTGARQPVVVPGINFANDVSEWLNHRPDDPVGQIAASFHAYDDNDCNQVACWEANVAPVAAHVPVITTELGEGDCAHGFLDEFVRWADSRQVSYLGWSWNPFDCRDQPALITSYDGTPTPYGVGLRDHLVSMAPPSTVPGPTNP